MQSRLLVSHKCRFTQLIEMTTAKLTKANSEFKVILNQPVPEVLLAL